MIIGTLWESSGCFDGYPLSALPKALVTEWRDRVGGEAPEAYLLRLQCFGEVTGERMKDEDLHSGRPPEFLRDFVAAHYSPRFIVLSRPWHAIARVKHAFATKVPEMRFPEYPTTNNTDAWPTDFAHSVASFASRQLAEDRVRFWQGWVVKNAGPYAVHLRLWRFALRYGETRTNELYVATLQATAGQLIAAQSAITAFADWMATYPVEVDFGDSAQIGSALSEFFPVFLRSMHEAGVRLASLGGAWRAFVHLMNAHLLGHAWAAPIPVLPMPNIPCAPTGTLNLRFAAHGPVMHGLITPIPIHVTDVEAKELLFRDIEQEFDVMLAWARAEVEQARLRLERRLRLAPTGIVSRPRSPGKFNGLPYRVSQACPDRLAHAAATFEATGLSQLNGQRATGRLYPRPISETTWELGLPTPGLLLAHATILIAKHPAITGGFLEGFELYDRDGQQSGLQETDAGWYLIGLKRRRGPRRAQQSILLDQETLRVIRDVVALTQPLRNWLRFKGDDRWRCLFLAISSLGCAPQVWSPRRYITVVQPWVAGRLTCILALPPRNASDLAKRFTLKRLRTSAAVLVYFRTGSVQRMAEALDHAQCSPTLLDHYLPRPLQEFFTERWLRIFQTQIVVESLRGSPHLLEATSFNTMSELDEFLENHVLRRIPSHLEDPDGLEAEVANDLPARVVFCVETGILTVLLSLEGAVRRATSLPCGRAIRWARIAERLVPYLESQVEQPEFRTIVAEAKRYADPSRVENLIYG